MNTKYLILPIITLFGLSSCSSDLFAISTSYVDKPKQHKQSLVYPPLQDTNAISLSNPLINYITYNQEPSEYEYNQDNNNGWHNVYNTNPTDYQFMTIGNTLITNEDIEGNFNSVDFSWYVEDLVPNTKYVLCLSTSYSDLAAQDSMLEINYLINGSSTNFINLYYSDFSMSNSLYTAFFTPTISQLNGSFIIHIEDWYSSKPIVSYSLYLYAIYSTERRVSTLSNYYGFDMSDETISSITQFITPLLVPTFYSYMNDEWFDSTLSGYQSGYNDGLQSSNPSVYNSGVADGRAEQSIIDNETISQLQNELSQYNNLTYHQIYTLGQQSVSSSGALINGIFGSVVGVPITILSSLNGATVYSIPIITILITFMSILLIIYVIKKFIK